MEPWMKFFKGNAKFAFPAYATGEETDDADAGDQGGKDDSGGGKSTYDPEFKSESDEPVKLTQKQLSALMAQTRNKYRTQANDATKQLQEITQQLSMTAEEKEKVKNRLDTIQASLRSEVEKKDDELTRIKQESERQAATLKQQLNDITNRYHTTLIDVAVAEACTQADVVKPKQMRSYIADKLKVVDELDSGGKPTGRNKVVVTDLNDAGEEVSYPVLDFIKKIDASGEDPNLFKHSFKSGINGSNGSGAGGSGASKRPTDPKELAEWLKDPANRANFNKQPVRRS